MALLFVLTVGLYWQTRTFLFLSWDDMGYVCANPMYAQGVTDKTLKQCLTENVVGNWSPLTMLSLTLDVYICKGKSYSTPREGKPNEDQMLAGLCLDVPEMRVMSHAMHLHNALLHACNAVLLALLLLVLQSRIRAVSNQQKIGMDIYCAFLLAAFWAWHPLRVESVAWVSSRKDVLCLFWYLIGHLTYFGLTFRGCKKKASKCESRYQLWGFAFSGMACICALMSKPTAVVFPFTLLLLEYGFSGLASIRQRLGFYALLCTLVIGVALTTCYYQTTAMAHGYALSTRILNGVATIGEYLRDTLYPVGLSPFYPYDTPIAFSRYAGGLIMCGILIYYVIEPVAHDLIGIWNQPARHEKPMWSTSAWLLVQSGVLWFLVALVPVIGIIHVGEACRADRYTYLSSVGFCIALLGLFEKMNRIWKWRVACLMSSGVLILAVFSHQQSVRWHDTRTLFTHALHVTRENSVAHAQLAIEALKLENYSEAFLHARQMSAQRNVESCYIALEDVLLKMLQAEGRLKKNATDVLDYSVFDAEPLAAEKWYAQAFIALGRKLTYAAEHAIAESVRLNPDDGYAWELYAHILLEKKEYAGAQEKIAIARQKMPKRQALYQKKWQ